MTERIHAYPGKLLEYFNVMYIKKENVVVIMGYM